jgi:hypothetical protein
MMGAMQDETGVYEYQPANGHLVWLKKTGRRSIVGSRAGWVQGQGYRYVRYQGRQVSEQRLIWKIAHGEWPPNGTEVDHKNGVRDDNRLINLRLASRPQNQYNSAGKQKSRSGLKGAFWHPSTGKWRSRISTKDGKKSLGLFDTPEEAHAAYVEAARMYHGQFARAA